jgi:hypothetical protein
VNRRTKKRLDELAKQLTYADELIARHNDAIDRLNVAKLKLRALCGLVEMQVRDVPNNEDVWTEAMTDNLSRITLEIRDCNWRQYG